MYSRVLDVLKNAEEPLKREEISKRAKVPVAKTALNLLRLREEGKAESRDKDGAIYWSFKEQDENEKKIEQRGEKLREQRAPAGSG